MKNGASFERLAFFVFILVLMAHFMSCTLIFVARIQFDEPNWITCTNMQNLDFLDIYWAGQYFATQTLTTVGYGDICVASVEERFLVIIF